jgi:hypothetical protein
MSDQQQPGAGRAILEAIAQLRAEVAEVKALLLRGGAPTALAVASDADLDGQYGNQAVRKDPPKWKGESHVGRKYSECSVEFLDEMAGFQAWVAGKEDAKAAAAPDGDAGKPERDTAEKNVWYARQRAGYARGWAARLRAGWKPPGAAPAAEGHPSGPSWD